MDIGNSGCSVDVSTDSFAVDMDEWGTNQPVDSTHAAGADAGGTVAYRPGRAWHQDLDQVEGAALALAGTRRTEEDIEADDMDRQRGIAAVIAAADAATERVDGLVADGNQHWGDRTGEAASWEMVQLLSKVVGVGVGVGVVVVSAEEACRKGDIQTLELLSKAVCGLALVRCGACQLLFSCYSLF